MNKNYYDEKIKTLPEDLQYAVMMSEWQKALIQIQTQFKLHIDQTQVLEDSTIKLMFGDIDAPDFISNMFSEAHINSETAADILLEVDLKILKNIRQRLEAIEEADKKTEELDNLLLDDEEKEAREDADDYADYYEKIDIANKETEEEMLKEGILPDGSNITDEMLGVTTEIPHDINKEKEDMLREIEGPTKPPINTTPIPTDHQLENIHIEEPFHQEEIIPKEIKIETAVEITPPPTPIPTPQEKPPEPEIKKPISIKITDTYREPLE